MKRTVDRKKNLPRVSGVLLCGLILSAGAAQSLAQPCGKIYRSNVSDLDQRRRASGSIPGLPNDGAMYCVPTSCVDHLCYMSNNGYPAAVSTAVLGPQLWGSDAMYNYTGLVIANMGSYLGTHPIDGTNNYTNGLLNYIDANLPNDYIVIYSDAFTKTHPLTAPDNSMASMIVMGALVNLHIGWFERRGSGASAYWERVGGHVTALNGVNDSCHDKPKLYWRDPNNNSSLYSQASYNTSSSRLTFTIDRFSWQDDPAVTTTWTYRIDDYTGTQKGFVGGYKAIWPNYGLGIPDVDADSLQVYIPKSLNQGGAPETFNAPISSIQGPVKFFDLHPSMTFSCAATNPPIVGVNDKLLRVEHADGSVRQLLSYTSSAGPLTFGNDGELYIADGSLLKAIDPDNGDMRAQTTFVRVPDAMVFDDVNRQIITLDVASKRIDRYNPATLAFVSTWLLPAGVTLDADAQLAISGENGQIWLATGIGGSTYSLTFSPTSGLQALAHSIPNITDPRAFQVTSKGDVLFNDGGVIEEAKRDPATGRYSAADRTGLGGLRYKGDFRITRTRSSFDPATIDLYESHDMLPAESIDCRVDLNDDGLVDFGDYLEFLNLFDAEDEAADFNEDGLIDFGDYLEFLNQYNEGCDD